MKNGKYSNKKGLNMKPLALLLALALVVGGVVGGTIAWLTAETGPVVNTFTVGDIEIKLEETAGQTYKVVPGATDKKDPKISVKEGSEPCYVYAFVVNNLVIKENNQNVDVATLNIDPSKWIPVKSLATTSGTKTLYRYHQIFTASADNKDNIVDYTLVDNVFTTVTYSGTEITKGNISQLSGKEIIVDAFAHQSANISDINVADAAAMGHFSLPTT